MTVNKLTLPAKENAVQSKINEIIDNFPTSTTVDQTYNGTSANPQSGVAINGELTSNYQTKLVSGTNIKTINNTSLLGSGNISVLQNTATGTNALTLLGTACSVPNGINIGYGSSADRECVSIGTNAITNNLGVAIGYNTEANYSHSTALGMASKSAANGAIQIGYGTNSTANTLSIGFYNNSAIHYNWQLLDGTTGLIPDARISNNIARTSAIPTSASDISAADTTLSNVSSIDSNSAVQTALDGKVSKSGDTMTGALAISEDATAKIEFTNTSFDATSTTAPASNLYAGAIDIFGSDNYHVGHFRTRHNTGNYFQSQMGVRRSINNTDYEANITVGIYAEGTASCSFPNTICCDGQWVNVYKEIFRDVSCNNSSDTSTGWYSLNGTDGLPSDSYSYECQIRVTAETDSTSGHMAVGIIQSDILSYGCAGARVMTRTKSTMIAQSTVIIPVNSNHRIRLARGSSWYGTVDATLIGYRRIGSNS